MIPVLFVLSLSVANVATPSTNASPAIACVLEHIDAAASAKLADEGGMLVETGFFSPAISAVRPPRETCKALHRWTDGQADVATRYAVAKLGLDSARAIIRSHNLDPAKIEAMYNAQPAAIRSRPMRREDADVLLDRLRAAGIGSTNEQIPIIGRYVGLLNLIDAAPVMLATD